MNRARKWMVGLGLVLGGLGCVEKDALTVLPFTVQIQLEGSEKSLLAGHSIEGAHAENDQVRAFGSIDRDGIAHLETYHRGKLLEGAQPGNYQMRIILNDDDPNERKKALKIIPAKFLQFKTSGWKIQIPSDTAPVLKLASK